MGVRLVGPQSTHPNSPHLIAPNLSRIHLILSDLTISQRVSRLIVPEVRDQPRFHRPPLSPATSSRNLQKLPLGSAAVLPSGKIFLYRYQRRDVDDGLPRAVEPGSKDGHRATGDD
jgi:hypothetical protein